MDIYVTLLKRIESTSLPNEAANSRHSECSTGGSLWRRQCTAAALSRTPCRCYYSTDSTTRPTPAPILFPSSDIRVFLVFYARIERRPASRLDTDPFFTSTAKLRAIAPTYVYICSPIYIYTYTFPLSRYHVVLLENGRNTGGEILLRRSIPSARDRDIFFHPRGHQTHICLTKVRR